jgi:hypothetical protein
MGIVQIVYLTSTAAHDKLIKISTGLTIGRIVPPSVWRILLTIFLEDFTSNYYNAGLLQPDGSYVRKKTHEKVPGCSKERTGRSSNVTGILWKKMKYFLNV